MALVFQYGSNCTPARLNGPNRLKGRAQDLGRVQTVEDFDIAFDVESKTNGCAASDLIQVPGRKAWGLLYEIPDEFIRGTRKDGEKTLEVVEGPRYHETMIRVRTADGREMDAITFVVRENDRRNDIATTAAYVSWIIYGLRDHGIPEDWIAHVLQVAIGTNERANAHAMEEIRLMKTL
jgi:hypothetical protein